MWWPGTEAAPGSRAVPSRVARTAIRLVDKFADRFGRTAKLGERGFPIRRRGSRSFQILTYHRVSTGSDPYLPATPTPVFETQMRVLAQYFSVRPLDEIVDRAVQRDLPESAVAITFDDGYRDNYTHALPILRRFSLPVTVFLATDAIGTGRLLWHDRVFRAFGETRRGSFVGPAPDDGGISWSSDSERVAARDRILETLKRLPKWRRDEEVRRLEVELDVARPAEKTGLMLDWSEVEEMTHLGVAFGAHTRSHSVLSTLSPEEAREEVLGSQADIRENLGLEPRSFAYPNGRRGDFDEVTQSIVRDAGFDYAVTTVFGSNSLDEPHRPGDLFDLRRVSLAESNGARFAARLLWYKFVS
jgi:peptidoglycan/xylan/chitin deacetylase (PgdA/CDA1 family)